MFVSIDLEAGREREWRADDRAGLTGRKPLYYANHQLMVWWLLRAMVMV